MKYRKKPFVIEAVQLAASIESQSEIEAFTHGLAQPAGDNAMIIPTLEGSMMASVGDYIIKGIRGEFYPIKADIFTATYEEVTEE